MTESSHTAIIPTLAARIADLVNQHIYGVYGYIAPILHLRRRAGADLFDTYLRSFELVWQEESREFTPTRQA